MPLFDLHAFLGISFVVLGGGRWNSTFRHMPDAAGNELGRKEAEGCRGKGRAEEPPRIGERGGAG